MLKFAERAALIVGAACLAAWAISTVSGRLGVHQEMRRFAAVRAAGAVQAEQPDLSLWSTKRIDAWRETMKRQAPAPLAVLRIRRVGIEVPVLKGTDDWTLNRAVGHIADTSAPGADGNCGIAGHRDGFFRPLKDVGPGDLLELETTQSLETYRIERTWIVDPEDVSVLDPTEARSVTLVTCFPFYFIDSAP